MGTNALETPDLFTFIEEIINRKRHFLYDLILVNSCFSQNKCQRLIPFIGEIIKSQNLLLSEKWEWRAEDQC